MSEQTPFERYVQQVLAHLTALPDEQRERVVRELQQHLEDAAQHANADPHDPQFQHQLIAQMGSSRRLGRDLARAHRPSTYWPYRIGSIAALCSTLGFFAAMPIGFLFRNEEVVMDTLFAVPVLLVPTMLVLHLIYQPLRPQMSWWTLIIGLLSTFALFMSAIYPYIVTFSEWIGFAHLGLDRALYITRRTYVFFPLFALIGVWYLLIGLLGRKTHIPATSEFSWMSIAAGISYPSLFLAILLNLVLPWLQVVQTPSPPIVHQMFWISLLVWALSHMACAGIAAIWLAEQSHKPITHNDTAATA